MDHNVQKPGWVKFTWVLAYVLIVMGVDYLWSGPGDESKPFRAEFLLVEFLIAIYMYGLYHSEGGFVQRHMNTVAWLKRLAKGAFGLSKGLLLVLFWLAVVIGLIILVIWGIHSLAAMGSMGLVILLLFLILMKM